MNASLAMVVTQDQLSALSRNADVGVECAVAGLDLDVLYLAEKAGRPCVDLYDFVSAEILDRNEGAAWLLCEQIGDALAGEVVSGQCDIARCMQNDLFFALNGILNAHDAVGAVIQSLGPEEILCFSDMADAVYWDPPFPAPDVFNAAAAWTAERAGVRLRWLSAPVSPIDVALEDRDSGPARASGSLPETCSGLSVLDWPLSVNEQRLFLSGKEKTGESGWVVAGVGPCTIDIPWIPVELLRRAPLTPPGSDSAAGITGDRLREMLVARLGRDYPVVFMNDHLAFLWDAFARWLLRGRRSHAAGEFLEVALHPQVVVTGYDVNGEMRCLQQAFLDRGRPVVAVDHAGLAVPHLGRRNRGARAHAAVWGAYDAEMHRRWRAAGTQVAEIGCLRPDVVPDGARGRVPDGVGPSARGGKRLVAKFFTAANRTPLFLHYHPTRLRASWLAVVDMLERREQWNVRLRPHPRIDNFAFYEHLVARAGGRLEIEGGPNTFDGVDVAVLMNCESKVLLEAVRYGVPVVYLKDAVLPVPHRATPLEKGGAVVVQSVPELECELERLANDSEYRALVLAQQKQFADRALVATGADAVERLERFIDEITAAPERPVAASEVSPRTLAARRILEMSMALGEFGRGVRPWPDLAARLKSLRERGMSDDGCRLLGVGVDMGTYLLSTALWSSWDVRVKASRGHVVWAVWRALPKALRPKWNTLRAHLVQGLLADAKGPAAPRYGRFPARVLAGVLAPGRIMARLHPKGGRSESGARTS